MSTIIWTILGWVSLAALVAWMWSRAKAHEKALLSKGAPVVCDGDTAVCLDCNGRGFNYSDPDGKQLVCWTCGGNMDNAMEEMGDRLGADAEDAEEGRQERLREKTDNVTFAGMDEAAKAMREKLESIFGQDDPDEAGPGERRTGREIKEIAAMILQEEGGRK